MISTFSALPYW